MSATDVAIRSQRVAIEGNVRPGAILVRDGVIAAIGSYDDFRGEPNQHDFADSVVMPGLVDTHVHINEPGRTDWEGFETATMSAAAGGITTLIEMPLNSIPATTTTDAFSAKIAAANGKLFVDVGFWGGVVPGNKAELRGLYEAGVFGFKSFLVPSGVPEFSCVTEADLREALPELASLGARLLVHAELPGPIEQAVATVVGEDPRRYCTWLQSRPRAAENEAIAMLIRLSREFDAAVHVVHLSSSDALDCIRQAKSQGLKLTVETCQHYLWFAAEDIPDSAVAFKCAPPLRERENREQLWKALGQGLIDMVATDHSPCPPEMKCLASGDLMRAWGGISSLQLSLPLMWTMARQREFDIGQLLRWLCAGPARLAGLARKGALKVGYDADMVVWNPEESFTVAPTTLHHRHKLTPYSGEKLYGTVQCTFLRGQETYEHDRFPVGAVGRVLKRGEA
jgi:allantoinase